MNTKFVLSLLMSCTMLVSCVSTTTIRTNVSGAKFYADGQFLGEDTVSYSDKKTVGSSTLIEIKKPGYKTKIASINRNGQLNAGALVGGILLAPTVVGLVFFFWVMDYNPHYVFEMEPEAQVAPALR